MMTKCGTHASVVYVVNTSAHVQYKPQCEDWLGQNRTSWTACYSNFIFKGNYCIELVMYIHVCVS